MVESNSRMVLDIGTGCDGIAVRQHGLPRRASPHRSGTAPRPLPQILTLISA